MADPQISAASPPLVSAPTAVVRPAALPAAQPSAAAPVAGDAYTGATPPAPAADPLHTYPASVVTATFLGRADVLQADQTERERVFGGKPAITLDEFVDKAQIRGMTRGQLEVMFKGVTKGKPLMTTDVFDMVFAVSTLDNQSYHTILRRPLGPESKSAARAIDNVTAASDVAKLAPAMATATAAWSPTQQASFARLQALVQDDPQAARALDTLVTTGQLVGEPKASNGLLESLDKLGTNKLAPGFDRATLLKDAVQEIADPTRINQGFDIGTCVSTSVQILLALHRPAEYVDILTGLASPAAAVSLPTGAVMTAVADVAQARKDDTRSLTSRLFQTAAQQFGSELPSNYQKAENDGRLTVIGEERLLHNVMGGHVDIAMLLPGKSTPASQAEFMRRLQQAASPDNPVMTGMAWGEQITDATSVTHNVVVTSVQAATVSLINPQGDEETLTRAEFLRRVRVAEFVGEGVVPQATGLAAQDEVVAAIKADWNAHQGTSP